MRLRSTPRPLETGPRPDASAARGSNRKEAAMTEHTGGANVLADAIAQWTENWKKMTDISVSMGEAWSNSMLPFIMTRAAENRAGLGDELGDAIERMAQGPKLADVWDIYRKLMSSFVAWTKMRQKLAAYN